MKNKYLIIAIIFLFACKKEKSEPIEKADLTGKLKSISFQVVKQEFAYNDTTGKLQNASFYYDNVLYVEDTLIRSNNVIYIGLSKVMVNQEGLIKSFKDANNKNYYSVSYTDKLNYFTDPEGSIVGNLKYYDFKMENGNYTSCLHRGISSFGGLPLIDTFNFEYTNLAFNKYAPYQKLTYNDNFTLNYLGYDDNFLFPQNKNLIKEIRVTNKSGLTYIIIGLEYEFNNLNQLIKMRYTNKINGLASDYIFEYY